MLSMAVYEVGWVNICKQNGTIFTLVVEETNMITQKTLCYFELSVGCCLLPLYLGANI